MRKYKVVETATVKRVYEIEAESKDEAIGKMHSGDFDPVKWDEDNGEVFVYGEDGNIIGKED